MPPDDRFQFLWDDFRPLACHLVLHHHCRGRGQTRSLIRFTLVFFPGFGNFLHCQFVCLAQPGHDFVEALSGHSARIVYKDSDFEQCLLL